MQVLSGAPENAHAESESTLLSSRGAYISNNSTFHQKHPGVPDGSDGSDGTSYPLTENSTLPVAQATGCSAYIPLSLISTMYFGHWKCLRVVGPESQGGQIAEFTGPMYWSSGAPGSTRDHIESLLSSLGKTSSLGMLLVRLEIIATTYCSTIFKTFASSSLYLCIYIATYLHAAYLDWQHAVIERKSRCAWRWRSSKLRDTLRARDRASLEMHFEAVIERVWRFTRKARTSQLRDSLGDRDLSSLEIHWEAVMEWAWWWNYWPRLSELSDAPRAVIQQVSRCTCSRLWSREIRGILGGGWSKGGRWEARQVLRLYSSVS